VGDNATRLAVRLLGDVAQGRGRTIPLDTGFIDDRATDVLLIRPLREFPANEVVMYATFNGLHSVSIPHLTTLEPEHTSIERLTESFVAGLQVDFPSTVSTVFRTGDKLTVGGDTQLLCALCQAPTGPPADPTVFTHLSQVDTCDRDVWTRLCYGCQLTVKDMKYDSSSLPPFVQNSNSMETRVDIHSRIADSLLEETNS
jgi:cytoplasmic tRNA 2-thiolation protein 2